MTLSKTIQIGYFRQSTTIWTILLIADVINVIMLNVFKYSAILMSDVMYNAILHSFFA